jgi:hypothetical protein
MLSRRPDGFAFAAALCLHALALWALRVPLVERISTPPFAAPPVADVVTFDIDFGEPAGSPDPRVVDQTMF